MKNWKTIIKTILSGRIITLLTSFFYGWRGNYSSWQEALNKSTGYDTKNILEKVKQATLKVRKGEAAFERDSVLFYEEDYNYPLLTALFWIAAQNNGRLHVLDFGGALGSTFYQNKSLFEEINDLKWYIAEQQAFVDEGIKNFQNNKLKFYYNIKSCLAENKIDLILLSSVLQYIEKPYELLNEIKNTGCKFVFIDRTPFIEGKDRITVQKVPASIYKAKYPSWFLNKKKFENYMTDFYTKIFEFNTNDYTNIKAEFKGYLFQRK